MITIYTKFHNFIDPLPSTSPPTFHHPCSRSLFHLFPHPTSSHPFSISSTSLVFLSCIYLLSLSVDLLYLTTFLSVQSYISSPLFTSLLPHILLHLPLHLCPLLSSRISFPRSISTSSVPIFIPYPYRPAHPSTHTSRFMFTKLLCYSLHSSAC